MVYMVGLFLKLDEMTIQKNIQRAYEYVNNHEMPTNFFIGMNANGEA